MLHVDGGIKMGNDSSACTRAKAGSVRWTGKDFEGCNGKNWLSLTSDNSSKSDSPIDTPIVKSATGRIWMDRNLGATQVTTAIDDSAAYGDLYQWRRGTDGHEKRKSNVTYTLSNSATPGHSNVWKVEEDKITTPVAVGIGKGATLPEAMLHVDGGIKIDNDSSTCTSAKAGTIRWTGKDFEGCTGKEWISLTGSISSHPDPSDGVPIVRSATGRIWMDRNLGATQVATAIDDSAAYGDLYQWGRGTDGHEKRKSKVTYTLSNSAAPGHSSFVYAYVQPQDWLAIQNDELWQNEGINNPCPSGFRLPTREEWQAELDAYGTSMEALFNSPLKLTAAGSRCPGFVTVVMCATPGTEGDYWSNTVSSEYSQYVEYLYFNRWDGIQLKSDSRANGMSVRCIKHQRTGQD
jgi:uncharacterized protein (TIGR02145 family)